MQVKKFMVVMGLTSIAMLGTASVSYANEIDKLTDNKQTTVQGSSSQGSSSADKDTSKNTEGSGKKATKSSGSSSPSTVERKSPVKGDLYDNEANDSSTGEDTLEQFRKELPKARNNDVLNQVQSTINKGKADAGDSARVITRPIAKVVMTIINVIISLLGAFFLLSTAISLLYAIAPFLRFLFDDDDVAQRTNQMAQASQGMGGVPARGFKDGLRSLLKVDDDMIQAMIEGDLMQGASQGAAMATGGGYGGQGMAFGGAYGGQQVTRQTLHNAPRAGKHVLWTYMKKRSFTLILLMIFISVFFTSVAMDMAGDISGLVVRLIDYVGMQIQNF